MTDLAKLAWTYRPRDFVEAPILEQGLFIADGEAIYELHDAAAVDDALRTRLEQRVRLILDTIQALTHRPYELDPPSLHSVNTDGSRHIVGYLQSTMAGVGTLRVDLQSLDTDGNVVHDTKAERIAFHDKLAREASLANDSLTRSLLDSYRRAVTDPANEMIHLYEIREALGKQYGGEHGVRARLGITRDSWSTLGRLANDEPLRQGRHRGKSPGQLRDASEAELGEARAAALAMLGAYLLRADEAPTA